jgi:polyvinyl alcohol dehydrogenase (cytochrome)
VSVAFTQTPAPSPAQSPTPSPAISPRLAFDESCQTCHGNATVSRAADPAVLRTMTPERIYAAMTTGVMQPQAQSLSDEVKRGIAEYLGDRKLGATEPGDAARMPNRCEAVLARAAPSASGASPPAQGSASSRRRAARGSQAIPSWNGWGADAANTRFQPAGSAGLSVGDVSRLRLKWAFGVPGATAVYGQPTLVGGRVFVGADTGYVYALDQATGCVHWSFQADAGVRSAVTVGPVHLVPPAATRSAAYFGDLNGNVYALEVETGRQLWKVSADTHALTRITASPVLHGGRLYVSVSSFEEGASTSPRYPCCTFRGSVVALRPDTGAQLWKTYTIPEPARPTRLSSAGVQQFGPSGGAVWSSPTIDVRRNALYVATGNAYSRPASPMTDALLALDLDSGRVQWSVQALANDAWIPGCVPGAAPIGNCPEDVGPDYDFGASPILKTLRTGRRVLVLVQKSGDAWAHDPDRRGALVWRSRVAQAPAGPDGELVWGAAADAGRVYVGLSSGGVTARLLTDGAPAWTTPLQPAPGRRGGQSGAVSAIPGAVLSGGWDGVLRAIEAETGTVLWEFDTLREFETVNRVPAKGGSMGAPGPTIAGGMLFVGSGYIGVRNGRAGNVLLAFSVDGQ